MPSRYDDPYARDPRMTGGHGYDRGASPIGRGYDRAPSPIGRGYDRAPSPIGRGYDRAPSPIQDISKYVEPLDDFNDSSHYSNPRADCITYPTINARGSTPPYGQSQSVFSSFGAERSRDYGR
ncbi:hypothetical protein COOONC_14466 [Cooperia oncophora]